jgi:hypothetical protein
MLGQDIVTRVRLILDDANATGWSNDELTAWINDACLFVALLRPDSCVVNSTITLAAGTKQSIAGMSPVGLRLMDVIYNVTTGRAMRLVDRRRLDSAQPTWHGATAAAPSDYTFDNRDPATFYVYPPALTSPAQVLNIVYSRVPVKITAAELASVTLSPPDIYLDPMINYVLFRAKAKEIEFAADQAAAAGYRALAGELLGVKGGVDKAFSPVQNSPGATPTPAGL